MMGRVNSVDSVMYQQMQYRHRYGMGNGKGLGQVMLQLTPEQRQEVSAALQAMPEEDRKEVKEQILQLDFSSMTHRKICLTLYFQSLGFLRSPLRYPKELMCMLKTFLHSSLFYT